MNSSIVISPDSLGATGEVIPKRIFRKTYGSIKKIGQDLSRELMDVYEEIPAYSVDISTGDLLNKTPNPIIKKVGQRNIQEFIQSFADDVDIYKILERVSLSGDISFLNRRVGQFGDFVSLPDNLNDMNDYVTKVFNDNSKIDKNLLEAAINTSLSKDNIAAIIAKHVESIVASHVKNNNSEVVE